ncbi:hypothetical protein GOODEAATRI_031795, partial [Goodea atripinnis]
TAAMAYFLPDAIDSWTDLIDDNNVTEASQSLRSKAEEIRKIIRTLREQFNINEYVGFGSVHFFTVMLALSVVLHVSEYEATVHLAACLGKTSPETMMEEDYLNQQYAYTVNNTGMTVPSETIRSTHSPLFKMFKAVFGDVFPSFNG